MKLTKTIFAVLIGVSLGLGWTAFAATNVSLTKNGALQYLNYIRDSFLIGGTATTSEARLSVFGSTTVTGTGIFGGELRVPNIVATSTTGTSMFMGGLVTDNIVSLSSSTIQRLFSTSLSVATTTVSAGRPLIVGGIAQVDRLIIQGLNSTNNAIDWNGGGGIHSDAGTLYIGGAGGSIYFRPSGHTSGTNQGNIDTTGRLYIGATGTPSLPAYVFQNNSNTGMFSSIPSFLQFSTNGTERMTLTSTGNVGIGTSTVLSKLHVADVSTVPPSEIGSFTLTTTNPKARMNFGVNTDSTMYSYIQSVQNGVSTRPLILNPLSGSVGIGTTTPANLFHLVGTGYPQIRSGYSESVYTTLGTTVNGHFVIGNSNVGIATALPWTKLAVAGGFGANASSTIGDGTYAGGLTVHGGATTTSLRVGIPIASERVLGTGSIAASNWVTSSTGFEIPGLTQLTQGKLYAAGNFNFFTSNGITQLSFPSIFIKGGSIADNTGYVGMGTTSPSSLLKVVGRLSAQPQFDCPVLINTVTAVVADQLGSATLAPTLCNGNMGWNMLGTTDGRIPAVTAALDNFVASGTPPMQLIDVAYTAPNNGGTTTSEGGVAISQALLGSATSSGGIAMEMFLATPTMTNALATTSFVAFAGFTNNTFVSTTSMKAWYGYKDSCMMIATSTPNWRLVCRNASVYYGKDTGVATTSTPFKILLTLNQGGFSAYFNNSNTAAANIPPANVPSAHLRAVIGAGTLAECSSISGGAAQLASQCGISTAKGTNALNVGQLTIWSSDW